MLRSLSAFGILFFAVALVSGQDAAAEAKYEEVLTKLLESLTQITKTLEMVVDEDSAKAQRAPLKTLAETFAKTRKDSKDFAPPSPEVREKLAQKFRPEFEKSRKTLIGEIARVERVPGGLATLQEIRGVFEKTGP